MASNYSFSPLDDVMVNNCSFSPLDDVMVNNCSFSPLDVVVPQKLFHTLHTIELSFDERRVIRFMSGHWHWSFYYSSIYLLLICGGQKYMRDKNPYNLHGARCCWFAGVSLFSFYAICRTFPIVYNVVYTGGFQHAVCDTGAYIGSGGGGIWAFLFPLSKLLQLVDTLFIVLRKREMPTLHWFHHVTVFVYCWYSYAFPISTGLCFGIVNYTVHMIVYAHYAVRASGRSPPWWIIKSLTIFHLSQMFAGFFWNYLAAHALWKNKTCEMKPFSIVVIIILYILYASLSSATRRMVISVFIGLLRIAGKLLSRARRLQTVYETTGKLGK